MRNRFALPALVVSIALLAGPGLAAAAPGEVVDGGVDLVAEGKIVKKDDGSLVVRTDDHGHKIEFTIDKSTTVPDDLAVGKHVSVLYHATGTHGQTADKVTVTPAKKASK